MESTNNTCYKEVTGTIDEIIREVRRLIREGNARSLIIKNSDGRILFQTQLTVGVAGVAIFTVMAPFISALTMFVMFANDVQVFVEREEDAPESGHDDEYEVDGEIIDIEDGDEESDEDSENDEKSGG